MNKYKSFLKYYKHFMGKATKQLPCLNKCNSCYYNKYNEKKEQCGVFWYLVKKYSLDIGPYGVNTNSMLPVLIKEMDELKIEKIKGILK